MNILSLQRWKPFSVRVIDKSACTIAHNIAPYDSWAHKSPEEPQQQLYSQQHHSLQAATSVERQSVQEEPRDRRENWERRIKTDQQWVISSFVVIYSLSAFLIADVGGETNLHLQRKILQSIAYVLMCRAVQCWCTHCVEMFTHCDFPYTVDDTLK